MTDSISNFPPSVQYHHPPAGDFVLHLQAFCRGGRRPVCLHFSLLRSSENRKCTLLRENGAANKQIGWKQETSVGDGGGGEWGGGRVVSQCWAVEVCVLSCLWAAGISGDSRAALWTGNRNKKRRNEEDGDEELQQSQRQRDVDWVKNISPKTAVFSFPLHELSFCLLSVKHFWHSSSGRWERRGRSSTSKWLFRRGRQPEVSMFRQQQQEAQECVHGHMTTWSYSQNIHVSPSVLWWTCRCKLKIQQLSFFKLYLFFWFLSECSGLIGQRVHDYGTWPYHHILLPSLFSFETNSSSTNELLQAPR